MVRETTDTGARIPSLPSAQVGPRWWVVLVAVCIGLTAVIAAARAVVPFLNLPVETKAEAATAPKALEDADKALGARIDAMGGSIDAKLDILIERLPKPKKGKAP
jgi:hypothetical protein